MMKAGAQQLPGTQVQERYCLVRIFAAAVMSSKVEVTVDSGQVRKRRLIGIETMKDKDTGKDKQFLSEADALNYFGAAGWQLVTAYPVVDSGSSCTHYLFKKTRPGQ